MPLPSQSRNLPKSSKLVNEALIAKHSLKGITLKQLYSYITETYSMVITRQREVFIKKHISSLREAEDIVNVTGSGLVGHFRLVNKTRFVRRLNAAERNTTRGNNDPSHVGTSTLQAKTPVNLPKRKRINMDSKETKRSDDRTKSVTTKRKQQEEVSPPPASDRIRRVTGKTKQSNAEPQSVRQSTPPPGSPISETVKTKQTNAKPRIVRVKKQWRAPLRTKQTNAEHQILSPDNLPLPESQAFPLYSQENTENTSPSDIARHSTANTKCVSPSVRVVHVALGMEQTNVVRMETQSTLEPQELFPRSSVRDTLLATPSTRVVQSPVQNEETRGSFTDEESEYAVPLDGTPTISSSVHASTPIPNCSVLLAPRRNKTKSLTHRDFTSSQSMVDGTPRSSLTKKRRRNDL